MNGTTQPLEAERHERRMHNLIRWHLAVAANGAIFRIRDGFRIQKLSLSEILVERDGRTRRFELRG